MTKTLSYLQKAIQENNRMNNKNAMAMKRYKSEIIR